MAPEIVSDDDSMEVAKILRKTMNLKCFFFDKVVNGKKVKRKRGKVDY